jgi:hypothetical protein
LGSFDRAMGPPHAADALVNGGQALGACPQNKLKHVLPLGRASK